MNETTRQQRLPAVCDSHHERGNCRLPGSPSSEVRYLQGLCVRGHHSAQLMETALQQFEQFYFNLRQSITLLRNPSEADQERLAHVERKLFACKALVLRARAAVRRLSCQADRRDASRDAAHIFLAQRAIVAALSDSNGPDRESTDEFRRHESTVAS